MVDVELRREPSRFTGRRAADVADLVAEARAGGLSEGFGTEEGARQGEIIQVLVYSSMKYVRDSWPVTEYVDRMNNGIDDALLLGIEREYVSGVIRNAIPPREQQLGRSTQ